MTAAEYRKLRRALGSQQKVAAALGVDYTTVQRREYGHIPVTPESALAIRQLTAWHMAERRKKSTET